MNEFKIGNVTIDNRYILAPMAGVCDMPYRVIAHDFDAGMVCTEMVSAKGIMYNNENTFTLLKTEEKERPVSLQLFGEDPDIISDMAHRIEEMPFDILDINMGCPVPKVVNNGEGSALLKDPVRIGHIIEKTAKAINKPVTAKIRIGFDKDHINAVEVAKVIESAGAAAITVHGRTREQYYSGEANWDVIAEVKDAVKIPVIGNGDITSYEVAKKRMEESKVDAIAIGRAARGNPWIFKELVARENNEDYTQPTLKEVFDMILYHAKKLCEFKGEYVGIREMRTHASFYLGGRPHAAKMRVKLCQIESLEELEEYLNSCLDSRG